MKENSLGKWALKWPIFRTRIGRPHHKHAWNSRHIHSSQPEPVYFSLVSLIFSFIVFIYFAFSFTIQTIFLSIHTTDAFLLFSSYTELLYFIFLNTFFKTVISLTISACTSIYYLYYRLFRHLSLSSSYKHTTVCYVDPGIRFRTNIWLHCIVYLLQALQTLSLDRKNTIKKTST